MLRKLRKHEIFLGREVDRFSILADGTAEDVDRHAADLERLLFLRRIELEQAGNVALHLRRLGLDGRDIFLVLGTLAPLLARRSENSREPGLEVLADRGEQRRADLFALPQAADF